MVSELFDTVQSPTPTSLLYCVYQLYFLKGSPFVWSTSCFLFHGFVLVGCRSVSFVDILTVR